MGTKERKQRERKHRKDQILTAAIELINRQGFEKTTMEEIADLAELSKGTLYLYFKDKSTLHQAIKKRGLSRLHTRFLEILQEDKKGADLVKKMSMTFLEFLTQQATFTQAMMMFERTNLGDLNEEHEIVEECRLLQNELLMIIVRSIQIGIQDKSITTELSPKLIALLIAAQMNGMLQFYLTDPNQKVQQILSENELTIPQLMEQYLNIQLSVSSE